MQGKVSESTLAAIYDDAATCLDAVGWSQASVGVGGGPRSLVGAVRTAVSLRHADQPEAVEPLVAGAVKVFEEISGTTMADWNDSVCKGDADAIGRLYAIASILRQLSHRVTGVEWSIESPASAAFSERVTTPALVVPPTSAATTHHARANKRRARPVRHSFSRGTARALVADALLDLRGDVRVMAGA